jgi:uncharacterized paraquat-inducible protein A
VYIGGGSHFGNGQSLGAVTVAVTFRFAQGLPTQRVKGTAMPAQNEWRQCSDCDALFFDGYGNKGTCPAGGGHRAAGFGDFALPHDEPGTPTAQTDWRFCHKCHAMFYNGPTYPTGVCPASGGHEAAGYNFVLPHDVQETPQSQAAWRYCQKCQVMFYDGSSSKGACPAGAGH